MSNSCSQLSTRGSREGAWQRRERRGASAVGLGSWSAFSCPSALIWYHERHAVARVSQDPSPRPHSVSFLHSRPSPCCEFLKKVTSRPSEIEKQPRVVLESRPSTRGSGGETRKRQVKNPPPWFPYENRFQIYQLMDRTLIAVKFSESLWTHCTHRSAIYSRVCTHMPQARKNDTWGAPEALSQKLSDWRPKRNTSLSSTFPSARTVRSETNGIRKPESSVHSLSVTRQVVRDQSTIFKSVSRLVSGEGGCPRISLKKLKLNPAGALCALLAICGQTMMRPTEGALTDATRSKSTGVGLQYATAGVLAQFTVTAYEENGVRRTSGGDDFIVQLGGTRALLGSVIDNLDGSYQATYMGTKSGAYEVSVKLLREGGLTASYFENVWFFYTPALVAVDPQINHDWGTGLLTPTATDYVSVRWEGKVKPYFTETYTFIATSDDGSKLWVDGVPLIDR